MASRPTAIPVLCEQEPAQGESLLVQGSHASWPRYSKDIGKEVAKEARCKDADKLLSAYLEEFKGREGKAPCRTASLP